MYDSYFQTCATLLMSNGHVCLLFVFTHRQFNHSYVRGYLEKSPIAVLKLTTAGVIEPLFPHSQSPPHPRKNGYGEKLL